MRGILLEKCFTLMGLHPTRIRQRGNISLALCLLRREVGLFCPHNPFILQIEQAAKAQGP